MEGWALTFHIAAITTGVLGFSGIAASKSGIAKIIFFIAIALFIISMVSRAVQGRSVL